MSNYFLIYLGSHFYSNYLFNKSNLILPSLTFFEKIATYLNLEGRFRKTKTAIFSKVNEIFADFEIIKGLHLFTIKYLNFTIIANFYDIIIKFGHILKFAIINFNKDLDMILFNDNSIQLQQIIFFVIYSVKFFVEVIFIKKILNILLEKNIFNYYQADLYSRNSKVLSLTALKFINKNFMCVSLN